MNRLIEAARNVVANWESGDLAQAVRELDAAAANEQEGHSLESIVLNVAGEIFGAMKRGGLREVEVDMIAADDPKALAEWVNQASLHHYLFQIAYPKMDDASNFNKEGEATPEHAQEYANGLDEFEAALMDVIDPTVFNCTRCGATTDLRNNDLCGACNALEDPVPEGMDPPKPGECPSDDCPSYDEPPGDTFKTSDGYTLSRKPRFWGNEYYWTDGDLSFRDVGGWPVDEDGGVRLVPFHK